MFRLWAGRLFLRPWGSQKKFLSWYLWMRWGDRGDYESFYRKETESFSFQQTFQQSTTIYCSAKRNERRRSEMKTWKFWAPKWILHQWPLCLRQPTLQQTHSMATDWLSLQKRSPTQSVQLPCQVGQAISTFFKAKKPSFIIWGKLEEDVLLCRSVQNFKGNERLMMVHSLFVHFFDYGKSSGRKNSSCWKRKICSNSSSCSNTKAVLKFSSIGKVSVITAKSKMQ